MPTSIARAKRQCACAARDHTARLVAFTGGPGAGKTAVLEVLRAALCEHVAVLPESASILFMGGFPRGDTYVGRAAAQRAIAHVQRELEAWALDEGNHSIVLCDRGTVDGIAYWPGDEDSFFAALGTERQMELSRYSAVIHLRTPSAHDGYDRTNPARVETVAKAREIDEAIAVAWRDHPRRYFVDPQRSFLDKTRAAMELVRALLPPCCSETLGLALADEPAA